MPHGQAILSLGFVALAMGLFASGKLRVDVVALSILALLLVAGLLRPEQALHGFASPATATVAAMFVLSAGLVRTGLVQWLARHLDSLAGKGEGRLILVLCVTIALLSAFIVNTATVAIFIPVAIALAKSRNVPASRVLIPLSFASQFGGVCTLIGTSTNILVNSIAVDQGLPAFGLFEFAPLGVVMCLVGIGYLMLVTRWLLPKRKGEAQQVDKYRLADYLAELRVKEDSPLIGQTWRAALAAGRNRGRKAPEARVALVKIVREEKATWRAQRTKIRAGDILLIHGNLKTLMGLQDEYGLELEADATIQDEELSSDEIKLLEVLVPPRSNLVGRTLRSSDFARRFGALVLAVQRRGRIVRERVASVRLEPGDTLLLQADQGDLPHLTESPDVILTNELSEMVLRRDRALMALLLLGGVVGLAAFNIVPILVAALIGSVGMILTRCISIEEAYQAIDWRVIFLLGGVLPLGLALEQSGGAAWLVEQVLSPLAGAGPVVVLAILYLLTALLTETMSNNAAAVLLAPIAFSLAAAMGVDARPFLIAITFAASTSFATPVGYQTNTMIYAPGGYRFTDYIRIGGPLNLVFWGLAVLLIPLLWPF